MSTHNDPKQIIVISGKGGTGKTSITGSFASLADKPVLADCDVDAADLSLILNTELEEEHDFSASSEPVIDYDDCVHCGTCAEVCRFDAVELNAEGRPLFIPIACEGCGVCSHMCPEGAIEMEPVISGQWFRSTTPYGTLLHAELGPGEENSGKLVAIVRQQAREAAIEQDKELVLIDGPPGIGCPVIAALSGVTCALVVTEPTLSGLHDLERIVQVCDHFDVPVQVCINRCDLNEENAERIRQYCAERDIEVVGTIPFDRDVVEALVHGRLVVEVSEGPAAQGIEEIWQRVIQFASDQ